MKNNLVFTKNGTSVELDNLRDIELEGGFGVCYIIDFGDNILKIGMTRQPYKRIKTISNISPKSINAIYISKPCLNYSQLETYLHRTFKADRLNGEYFCVKVDDVIQTIGKFNFIVEKEKEKTTFEKLKELVNITEKIFSRNGTNNSIESAIEFVVTNCEEFGIFLTLEPLTKEELSVML